MGRPGLGAGGSVGPALQLNSPSIQPCIPSSLPQWLIPNRHLVPQILSQHLLLEKTTRYGVGKVWAQHRKLQVLLRADHSQRGYLAAWGKHLKRGTPKAVEI